MAENEDIQKLNKSVESIAKHLGSQGSPAQAKKDAELRSKTAQQEAENASDESDLLDDQEKGEKESRKLFSGTMASAAFVWSNLSTHVFSKMNEIFGAVVGHVKEVLGPVVAVYDAAKATLLGAFDFIKGSIMSFKDKTTPAEKKTHGFLKTISLFAKKSMDQMRGSFLGTIGEDDKKGKMGMFAKAMFLIGAIIGGIVAAILKPFVLLGKAIKGIASMIMKIPKVGKAIGRIGKFLRSIKAAFASLPGVGKVGGALKKVGGFFKKVGSILKWIIGKIGGVLKWVLSKIPGVSGLFKGLKYGFKVLGWPIAVLFGIIDFIKGFISEFGKSGSIIDSIGEGLRSALIGFIELPVKMVGWIIDKVLGWFGIEGADSANKMLGWINDAFDFVFGIIKWYWTTLIDIFKNLFGPMWDLIKWYWTQVIDIFKAVFGGIWDLIEPFAEKIWPEIKEWLDLIFEGIKFIFGGLWDKVKGIWDWWGDDDDDEKPVPNTPPKTKKLTQAEQAAELEKLREEQRQIAAKEKADKEAADKAAKGGKAVVVSSNVAGGGGGEAVPQIPDEVDNWGVTSKNYDMEMF